MNWEAIGAVGEIVGALAVVATLGYLAVQIRQNTRVARSAARQAIAQMTMSSASNLVEDGELADLVARDLAGEQLIDGERLRVMGRSYIAMRNWENIHYQYLTGMLSDDEWSGFRLNLKALLQWPSTQRYWSNENHYYSKAFREEVAALLEEVQASPGEMDHRYVSRGADGD